MDLRVKLLIAAVVSAAVIATAAAACLPVGQWPLFLVYVAALLLSSRMKVSLLKTDGTLSVSFLFILLAVLQLSPLQSMGIAAISVFAQCRIQVKQLFSLVQAGFNIANAVNATALCILAYTAVLRAHGGAAPALAVGAIVYFAANTLPVATVIGWVSGKPPLSLWRNDFFWFFPFYLVGAGLAILAHFLSRRYGWATALLVLPAAYIVYRSYNSQIARIRDHEQHLEEMEALHLRTIESLAMAIEAKDQDTHDHLLRVRVYVAALGKALDLSHHELEAVKTAALLHDIGKLAVPERIINKPGKLTAEEFETMKIHTVVGADILQRVRFPFPVVPIVRSHHEWWNGMGYPDGLRGEDIPIGARILSAVDSFDAMASDRPYRRAMPPADAIGIIKKMSGTQFDPRVVDVLEQQYEKLEQEARTEGKKLLRLNTDVSVSRGLAPGAGFERDSTDILNDASTTEQDGVNEHAHQKLGHDDPLLAVELRTRIESFRTNVLASGNLTAEEALALLGVRLACVLPFDCIVFYQKAGEKLVSLRSGVLADRLFSPAPIAVGEGLSGWAALHEHGIVNGNPGVEPNYRPPGRGEVGLHAALALPLRMHDDRLLGVLTLYASKADAFAKSDLRALEAAEVVLAGALDCVLRLPTPIADRTSLQSQAGSLATLHAAVEQLRTREEAFALLACRFNKSSLNISSTFIHTILAGASIAGGLAFPVSSLWFLVLPGAASPQADRCMQALADALFEADSDSDLAFGIAFSTENWTTIEALLARAERRIQPMAQHSLLMPSPVVAA